MGGGHCAIVDLFALESKLLTNCELLSNTVNGVVAIKVGVMVGVIVIVGVVIVGVVIVVDVGVKVLKCCHGVNSGCLKGRFGVTRSLSVAVSVPALTAVVAWTDAPPLCSSLLVPPLSDAEAVSVCTTGLESAIAKSVVSVVTDAVTSGRLIK